MQITSRRAHIHRVGLSASIALLGVASCRAHEAQPLQSADLAGEYHGKVQIAADQPELPISLSLRSDGRFVGDFPDPYLTWGGHMRAIGTWRTAGTDARRDCMLIELTAEGRLARAHCASREPDGKIGLNCGAALDGSRRCAMKRTRPAER